MTLKDIPEGTQLTDRQFFNYFFFSQLEDPSKEQIAENVRKAKEMGLDKLEYKSPEEFLKPH